MVVIIEAIRAPLAELVCRQNNSSTLAGICPFSAESLRGDSPTLTLCLLPNDWHHRHD